MGIPKSSPKADSSLFSSDLIALAQRHTFGQKITVTRCCNNYGPWQDKEKVIPTFILNAIQGNSMPIYGSGMNIREWIHVEDHCLAIQGVIQKGESGEIYNIGSGESLTNLKIAKLLVETFGKGPDQIEFVQDRLGHDFRYALNSKKIFDLTGINVNKRLIPFLRDSLS